MKIVKKENLTKDVIDACEKLVTENFYGSDKCGLVSRFQTMLEDGEEVLLYEMEGTIVAFLIIGKLHEVNPNDVLSESIQYDNNLFLIQLSVSKQYQRQGIGSKMMKYAMNMYPSRDVCYLWVTDTNIKAMNCYLKLGFEKIGTFCGEYEFIKDYCAYLMRLKLK